MKHIQAYIIIGIISLLIIIAYSAYYYYAPPQLMTPYQTGKVNDTLRIAYIGDSWAFLHKNHTCQIPKILESKLHRPVQIYSYGICGHTSKEIYKSLFDNADMKRFFQIRGYQFCFVSAGINDTYKKMSTSYYQQSMDGIILFLLENHIHPIILEIPDYDIQKSFERQAFSRKQLRRLSMFITNTNIDCKQQFRNALDSLITKKGYNNQIGIIRYKTWNNNGPRDQMILYQNDGLHLNAKGYDVLDSAIISYILRTFSAV